MQMSWLDHVAIIGRIRSWQLSMAEAMEMDEKEHFGSELHGIGVSIRYIGLIPFSIENTLEPIDSIPRFYSILNSTSVSPLAVTWSLDCECGHNYVHIPRGIILSTPQRY